MAGRPSKYSPALVDKICREIREGKSIHSLTTEAGMPCEDTIYEWLNTKPDFSEKYARAREERADRMAEEILDIADDATKDTKEIKNDDGKVIGEVCDHEWVNRSRLRVDSRKWLMARMAPKKYGDKITQEVTGKDGNPIQVTVRWGKKPDAES